MTKPVSLNLAAAAHRALYEAANGKAKAPKVERAALFDLLADHARVIAALHEAGIITTTNGSN